MDRISDTHSAHYGPEMSAKFWLQFLFALTIAVRDLLQTADDAMAHKALDAINEIHHKVVGLVMRRVKGDTGGYSDHAIFELVMLGGRDRGVGFLVEAALENAAEVAGKPITN